MHYYGLLLWHFIMQNLVRRHRESAGRTLIFYFISCKDIYMLKKFNRARESTLNSIYEACIAIHCASIIAKAMQYNMSNALSLAAKFVHEKKYFSD